jgi:methyl coenzyme M reductase subunit C
VIRYLTKNTSIRQVALEAGRATYVVEQHGHGPTGDLAQAATQAEAEEAQRVLAMLPGFKGLTRDEALEIVNKAVRLGNVIGPYGALRALADAGAFSDGKNMSDRLPWSQK